MTLKKLRPLIINNLYLIIAAIFGITIFLSIFGIEPLRFTGIGWTLYGYDNSDITQHQTGWMFYRNSPWTFPLCNASYLEFPEGTPITYTDSIPLVNNKAVGDQR